MISARSPSVLTDTNVLTIDRDANLEDTEGALHNIFRFWEIPMGAEFRVTEESSVTTIEAVIFGMLLSWTPCVVLMAYLFVARPARMGPDRLRRRLEI